MLIEDINNVELATAVKLLRTCSSVKQNVMSVNTSQAAEQAFGESSDCTKYSISTHNVISMQSSCVRAENLSMSERVDIFLMLHLVEAVYKFSNVLAGTASGVSAGGIAAEFEYERIV